MISSDYFMSSGRMVAVPAFKVAHEPLGLQKYKYLFRYIFYNCITLPVFLVLLASKPHTANTVKKVIRNNQFFGVPGISAIHCEYCQKYKIFFIL